jgi:predicted regulator of Ras-like GTPase activity (Roadblock/LC7/MglB family)
MNHPSAAPAATPDGSNLPTRDLFGRPELPGRSELNWLLDGFVAETAGVTHAVVVAVDGLQIARAAAVGRDLADQLAACTSGLLSLANQCGRLLGSGSTEHVTIRFGDGHLLCMRIGGTAGLMVAAEAGADLRVLAYAMSQFAAGAAQVLAPTARQA